LAEFALGLQVVVLGGASAWLTWTRESRPIALWTRGWLFLFASAVVVTLGGGAPWAESMVRLLGPFFPALVLAGALAHAGRPVPGWLMPLAFVLGLARWGFGQGGYDSLGHGIALVFEPGAVLAAAFFAFRAARRPPVSLRRHLLAPAFLAIAAVETASAIWGVRGSGLTTPLLLAWAVVAPFAFGVQVGVTREGFLGRQRRVEQALSESEDRFRALSDNAFDLVAEMDRKGCFTYTNPRYEEWTGIPGAELIGTRGVDLVHPEDHERILAWFRDQGRSGSESLIAVRARHRSGDWRWVEVSGRPFHAAGELRIASNSRDVTERIGLSERLQKAHDRLEERVKERTAQLREAVAGLEEEVAERRRVEHELRASEERWRNVSELSSDLSFALTREPDGSFTTDWATQAIARISGRSLEEIEAHGWPSIMHPEDLGPVATHMSQIRDGETREYDARIITLDGDERWVKTRITGARSPLDGKLRVLGAGRDVTEARRVEEQRRRLEAHMQEAQKLESLGVLAGGIAHDFNNLLAVVLGNDALAMSEAKPGSRLAKQLERIRSAAKHAQALTSQMLTYSGKASISLKPLDLSRLVEEMSDLLEASISKKCRLEIALAHSRTLVEGDPTQLRQVILNLVTNASEALGDDRSGRIALRSGLMTADAAYLADTFGVGDLAAGEYVYLEVSDPGQGIDEETRNRIFEPFFSTKFTGRGLGLASVLGIVRSHRGAIKLVTGAGDGTRFRVLLPPAAGTALPAASGPRNRRAGRRSGTILVVDDDEAVLEVACEFLVRGGLDVVTAGGGRDALEILRSDVRGRIDAVVLDLAMPDLDGRETLLEIRRLRPQLPVVVASGFRKDTGAEQFPNEAIASFIRKPYDAEELIDAVQISLAGRPESANS
jgi:PAS domain S-box-containing protein